jgi:hypothetical protein
MVVSAAVAASAAGDAVLTGDGSGVTAACCGADHALAGAGAAVPRICRS